MSQKIVIKTTRKSLNYSVEIGRGNLADVGTFTVSKLVGGCRIALISNKTVFNFYGQQTISSLERSGFKTVVHLIGDGEKFKNLKTLGTILDALSDFGIGRTDAVAGLGGGVVGDITGFAASIHLRGVDYLQIPTTLLSMVDSSVGGKTGINTSFGKNLVGAFYPPKGVLIDPQVLSTLPKRELTAGICECIKHGILSGPALFKQTAACIEMFDFNRPKPMQKQLVSDEFERFLVEQIRLKSRIVAADERESTEKTDSRSRKVLNFGHTFAHALERATNYTYLKHGEAVGYGIVFAAELSKKFGLLDEKIVNLLRDVVHRSGSLPPIGGIDSEAIFKALRHDKKKVKESIQWVLLKGLGKPVIVPHDQLGDVLVRRRIKEFISAN